MFFPAAVFSIARPLDPPLPHPHPHSHTSMPAIQRDWPALRDHARVALRGHGRLRRPRVAAAAAIVLFTVLAALEEGRADVPAVGGGGGGGRALVAVGGGSSLILRSAVLQSLRRGESG